MGMFPHNLLVTAFVIHDVITTSPFIIPQFGRHACKLFVLCKGRLNSTQMEYVQNQLNVQVLFCLFPHLYLTAIYKILPIDSRDGPEQPVW